jgi:hypothetical protein
VGSADGHNRQARRDDYQQTEQAKDPGRPISLPTTRATSEQTGKRIDMPAAMPPAMTARPPEPPHWHLMLQDTI